MRRGTAVTGLMALALVAMVACAAGQGGTTAGQGQGRGGGGRGMMGSFMYLERTWTAVSFQLGCTAAQLQALKPTYQNTLAARDAAVKQAMAAQNWEAAGKASTDARTRLDAKLKAVLTAQQLAKLQQLMQPPQGMGRPGGGGGFRPGGGGAAPR